MVDKLENIENYITNLEETINELSCTMNNMITEFETLKNISNKKKEDKHNLSNLKKLMSGGTNIINPDSENLITNIITPNRENFIEFKSTGVMRTLDTQYTGNLKGLALKNEVKKD